MADDVPPGDRARRARRLRSSLLKELTDGSGVLSFSPERSLEIKGPSGTRRVYSVERDDITAPA